MGRKSRKKYKHTEWNKFEDESDGEDIQLLKVQQLTKEYEKIEKILITRLKMLNYRKDKSLSICEFLTPEIMIDFVNNILN